jgi:Na+/H+-dicarboxylate symporter
MPIYNVTGFLTDENIDQFVKEACLAYMNSTKADSNVEMKKLRLALEEILLRFRDAYGTKEPCTIKAYRFMGTGRFVIAQKGSQSNPLNVDSDLEMSYDILARMDIVPKYNYQSRRGKNCVTVPAPRIQKKNVLLKQLLAALVLAIITCKLAEFLPGGVVEEYLHPAITSVFKKLASLFSAIATPLVFCAVITGISGLGDAASFGKIGSKFIGRMMCTYVFAMVAMILVGAPMGLIAFNRTSGGENVFIQLLDLVLEMVPGNLIEPFRVDNDLQVIVLAVYIGLTILILGEKISDVRTFIFEAGDVVNRMMLILCKVLPLFVYLGVCDLVMSGRLNNLGQASKIITIALVGQVITISYVIIRTLISSKRPFRELFAAQVPSLVINLTTSSQVSALPASMECCKNKFGIDEKLVDFGLPFGIVVYMPNGAILLGTVVWVLTSIGTGPLDMTMVLKIAIVAMVVAIAAPPIPGSALAVMPILFSASGTDPGMMPIAVIAASTVGYLLPAMNGYCLQLELLRLAVDTDMLKKNSSDKK